MVNALVLQREGTHLNMIYHRAHREHRDRSSRLDPVLEGSALCAF